MIRVRRSAVIDAPIERVWAVLRDFNSHSAWHPAVGPSEIEHGEPSDQIGCVRSFTLKDGNQIREQLLALSDRDYVSTYCILDATLPMRNYVATVQLKRVTDGDRTFWHWESTFDVPRGREREFEQLVGGEVYEAGFAALAAYLRSDGRPVSPLAGSGLAGRGGDGVRRSRSPANETARLAGAEERRGAPATGGDRRQLHRRLHPQGALPPDRAPGADRHGSGRRRPRKPCPGFQPRRPGRVRLHTAGRVRDGAHLAGGAARSAPGPRERGSRGRAHAEGHDRRIPPAPHAPGEARRRGPGARRGRRRRACCSASGPGRSARASSERCRAKPRPSSRARTAASIRS